MGKYTQSMVLNGYFYECEYLEYNEKEETYKDPIKIRFKQNQEGIQGVSGGGKKTSMIQESQGKEVYKKSITIRVINNLPYKPYDMIRILGENTRYIIKDVFEDYASVNSINNLQFKRLRSNKSYVLVMGER